MLDSLLLGDCLEVMATLPDQSIDCVLSDLPYGTTRNKWDSVIPLGQLWEQYRRLVKVGGAIILTAQTPFDKVLGCSNLAWLRHEWVWLKEQGTGHLNANRAPMKVHEHVLVFCSKQPPYAPQWRPGTAYSRSASAVLSPNYGRYVERSRTKNAQRYPTTALSFPHDHPRIHPTQKPVALFSYLIKTYTNPDAVVLDNAAGSGTTVVACIETGRHYIAIERDETYFTVAQQRIAAAQEQAQGGPLFAAS